METALRMPEEMTRSTLDYLTLYIKDQDYFPQGKTRANLKGMKPALQEYQENFISSWGSVHWGQGFLQCFDPLKFSFHDSLLSAKPNPGLKNNVLAEKLF